jgi:hypothetical protein
MDHELDYFVLFTCGCRVVFDYTCHYKSSRLDMCEEHKVAGKQNERDSIVRQARMQRDAELVRRGLQN